jgi:hypothetical protein
MFPEGRESVDVTVFTQAPDEELMRRFVEKYAPPR